MSVGYIFMALAFIIGFAIAWYIAQKRPAPKLNEEKQSLQSKIQVLESQLDSAEKLKAEKKAKAKAKKDAKLKAKVKADASVSSSRK